MLPIGQLLTYLCILIYYCHMAQYITPEVRDILSASDSETAVTLALVPENGSGSDIKTRAGNYPTVSVQRELPSGVLIVDCQVSSADEFLSTSKIASASRPDRMRIME